MAEGVPDRTDIVAGPGEASDAAVTTASEIIARRLHAAGCRHAFTIPGGEVLALMQALENAGIRVTLVRHENAGGFMAEGVHHHDGAPGILLTTLGPGLANATNVIANALQDRVPLIVLSGCVPALEAETYTHQVFDHTALLAPITKAVFRVAPGTAGVVADKALAMALDGQPGPVLIDVPIDVQKAEVPAGEMPAPRRPRPSPAAPAPGPDLERARAWLAEAERPLVIAGVDVLNQEASAAVARFCRTYSAPLITTYKAKGVLPEDDPLALGGAGLSPRVDAHLLPLVKRADLVLLAGYDPIEMRIGWRNPWNEGARVVELSAVPNTHYMHTAALSFVGDVGAGLAALGDGIAARAGTWPDGEPARARDAIRAGDGRDETWGPAAIVDECRKVLPRNAVATVDSGAHRILLSQIWACYEPRGLLQSTALCTMGCALPLAMGRKLAEPDRPVIAFSGDAGLEMVLGELTTLRDLRLPLPIIVFTDASLALIALKQRGAGYDTLAVDFGASDFPAIARALGGHGAWCEDRATLRAELEAALARETFTLIAARIDARAYEGRL